MIFLSLGTHEDPFPRAIELISTAVASGEDLVVQHGHTPPRPDLPSTEWIRYVGYQELVAEVVRARAFVCHAGVGSILTALTHGVTPVVIPRERRFGEHVDDHQGQLARHLGKRGVVVLIEGDDVLGALARAEALRGAPRGPGIDLRRAVAFSTVATTG